MRRVFEAITTDSVSVYISGVYSVADIQKAHAVSIRSAAPAYSRLLTDTGSGKPPNRRQATREAVGSMRDWRLEKTLESDLETQHALRYRVGEYIEKYIVNDDYIAVGLANGLGHQPRPYKNVLCTMVSVSKLTDSIN